MDKFRKIAVLFFKDSKYKYVRYALEAVIMIIFAAVLFWSGYGIEATTTHTNAAELSAQVANLKERNRNLTSQIDNLVCNNNRLEKKNRSYTDKYRDLKA